MSNLPRASLAAGAKAIAPFGFGAVPFGLVLGLTITGAAEVNNFAGWSSSWLIAAGAAQLAAIGLLADGAGVLTTVVTIVVINARHVMYSAAMSARFRELPRWFKIVGPYFLIDQVFAVAIGVDRDAAPEHRMAHYLGSALTIFSIWFTSVAFGLALGDAIPESWSLGYTVPLLFLALLILGVNNLPGVLAAISGGVVAVLGRDFPNGSGLLAGAILGVLVGGLSEWFLDRRIPAVDSP
ncbi:MAG: AzlC family ABC transporter permease [Acidimicrobiales bacterium]